MTDATDAEAPGRSTPAAPREQAVSALFAFAFLALVRLTGVSALFFDPTPRNPLAASPLQDVGAFLFYDAFVLVLLALAASAYLTARYLVTVDLPDETLQLVDTLAALGLSGSSLLLIGGGLLQVV